MATKKAKAPVGRVKKYDSVQPIIAAITKEYESQAEAARTFDMNKTYWSRLLSGVKVNPSDDVLSRLGIERHISYSRV